MKEEDLLYALALQRAKGIGDINAKKLIKVCGSPKNVLKERKKTLQKIDGIGAVTLKNLFDSENLKAAELEIKLISQYQIKPLYFLEEAYPKKLLNCIDSPILMFQDGRFNFENRKIISIVGTRKMTTYGRDFCESLLADLKSYDPVVVSGFAYGVDICAHKAAVKNNLCTVGVFAHGFGDLYPKTHKKYMAQMYERGGFLTEFWYNEGALRENFLKRNRIVAGIAEATIIVESAPKGGALVTADIANSYGKEVLAVPGRTSDYYSKGCNALIRDNKAAILMSSEDLVRFLGWEENKEQKVIQPQLFLDLTTEEQLIYDFLASKGKELLDRISIETKIPVYKIAAVLFQLEMKGVVRALPGKLYEII
ncbi:DNA-processing protein DprA [Flavicella sediminum]|uniref:DNA-processing protein DprA n=1 Tax=Flavicella sediminum TaxID=2585141 RepID=UPI0011241332|nr:DNA-processing protein DprA [Flavicella sediminum]